MLIRFIINRDIFKFMGGGGGCKICTLVKVLGALGFMVGKSLEMGIFGPFYYNM
jgi:hypothetical protein